MARKVVVEFRVIGQCITLKKRGDPLEGGEKRLAAITLSVVHASILFNEDDAHRDALLLFATAYGPKDSDAEPIDAQYLHRVVRKKRLLIIGAALAASALQS